MDSMVLQFDMYHQVSGLAGSGDISTFWHDDIMVAINAFRNENVQFSFGLDAAVTGTLVALLFGKFAFPAALVANADSCEISERAS